MPRKPKSAARDQTRVDSHFSDVAAAADPQTVIAQIRYWHRQRCFAMEQRKRSHLALYAFLRTMLGWSMQLDDSERKRIAASAIALADDPAGSEWAGVIAAARAAAGPFEKIERRALKEMSALAVSLPAWQSFGQGIRGFGAASFAVIVAEAGDLSLYANPGKLWKRMGLAVVGSIRQGGLTKGASAEAWIEHGYNPARRSRMWNIGDALIKGNRDGEYRTLYLERKQYEIARDPQIKPIKAHRRAQRYMEKRLLKKLWQAWRRAGLRMSTGPSLSDASLSAQAAQQATQRLQPIPAVPVANNSAHAERRIRGTMSPSTHMSAASS